MWGRDVFGFWTTKTGIYPFGTDGDPYECNNTFGGMGCAAYVLKKEWIINNFCIDKKFSLKCFFSIVKIFK